MPVNPNVESPTFAPLPTINAAGNYIFGDGRGGGATLRGIDIYEDGDVKVIDCGGVTKTRTFTGISGSLPFRWVVQIYQIFGAANGTTVPIASLDFLR